LDFTTIGEVKMKKIDLGIIIYEKLSIPTILDGYGVEPQSFPIVIYENKDEIGVAVLYGNEVVSYEGSNNPRRLISLWRSTMILSYFDFIGEKDFNNAMSAGTRFVEGYPRRYIFDKIGELYSVIRDMIIPQEIIDYILKKHAEGKLDSRYDLSEIPEEILAGTLMWDKRFINLDIRLHELIKNIFYDLITSYAKSKKWTWNRLKSGYFDRMLTLKNALLKIMEKEELYCKNHGILVALAGILVELDKYGFSFENGFFIKGRKNDSYFQALKSEAVMFSARWLSKITDHSFFPRRILCRISDRYKKNNFKPLRKVFCFIGRNKKGYISYLEAYNLLNKLLDEHFFVNSEEVREVG
jgi:hypothetical protein